MNDKNKESYITFQVTEPENNCYYIKGIIPGYDIKHIGIRIQNDTLSISCNFQQTIQEIGILNSFYREFILLKEANINEISASYKSGFLIIKIPMHQDAPFTKIVKINFL